MNKCKILCLAMLFLFGCNYNQSKVSSDKMPATTQKITSPDQLTYKLVKESVLLNACLKCHSEAGGNKGGINLENFENVFKNSHQIRIEVAGGTMPPTGKLSEEQIKIVTDWIDAGAAENGKVAGELPTPKPTPTPTSTSTPIPAPVPNPVPQKISFEMVYNQVIKTNCLKCHSEIGGNHGEVNLEAYDRVFAKRFEVKFEIETNQMPTQKGTALTEIQKKLILTWIQQGSLK